MMHTDKTPIIEMRSIVKEFPGVRALSDMTFDVSSGEVHCLVGENGAGKSTLMKILAGAYTPTSGSIVVDGKAHDALRRRSPPNWASKSSTRKMTWFPP